MNYHHLLEKFRTEHILRGSSPRTIKSYVNNCRMIFEYLQKEPSEITNDDLRQYIHHLIDKSYEAKTCNQKIYSIKSFYNFLGEEGKENAATHLPRQKEPVKIPQILGKKDLSLVLGSLTNQKHRALLTTAYYAGLRLNEVRLLKVTDIDSARMVILVNGKGNKQRLVPLFQKSLDLLREYYKNYKPKKWLFEGRGGNRPLCSRSLHEIVKHAVRLAGIKKRVSMHTLRHCFATHLLENGVAMQTIQHVLGHKDIVTTAHYTHVTDEMIARVKSPLSDLNSSDEEKPLEEKGGCDE